jgi:4-hydroxybenzoate polyprenyltransferase
VDHADRPSSSIRALAMSSHPVPTAAVTVLTVVLAAAAGHSAGRVALVAAAVLSGQLSIGWSNDAIDADRDASADRSDKPVAAGAVSRRTVALAGMVALALTVLLSVAVGVIAGLVHLLFVGCGWAYNLGLKRTAVSFVPYAIGFAALPSFVVIALPGNPAVPWWLASAGGLLGVGAHVVNVLPDLDDDLAAGVRGWPHRLGRRRATLASATVLAAASVLLTLAPAGAPDVGALIALGLALVATASVAWLGWHRPAAGRVLLLGVVLVALIDIGLLVAGTDRLG